MSAVSGTSVLNPARIAFSLGSFCCVVFRYCTRALSAACCACRTAICELYLVTLFLEGRKKARSQMITTSTVTPIVMSTHGFLHSREVSEGLMGSSVRTGQSAGCGHFR